MPRRSLVEHRPWLFASLAAAIAYYFLSDDALGELWQVAIKGGAILCLAIYALQRHPGSDAKILSGSLLLAAIGTMALELFPLWAGLFLFFSYAASIALYLRHRRPAPSYSQRALGLALLVATPLIAFAMTGDLNVIAYGLVVGAMGFAAWLSAFPRYRVGVGAVMIVAAELLWFAHGDQPGEQNLVDWLYWPLFFAGQFSVATGVIQSLRGQPVNR